MSDDLEPMSPVDGVERFLQYREPSIRPSSLRNARHRLGVFLKWCEEADVENLNELNGRALDNFVRLRQVLLLLLVEIDGNYSAGFDPRVVGLASIGILLVVGSYIWEYGVDLSLGEDAAERMRPVVISALVVVVLSVMIGGIFPAELVRDGSFTNIIGHAAGFVWGSLIALGTYAVPNGIGDTGSHEKQGEMSSR